MERRLSSVYEAVKTLVLGFSEVLSGQPPTVCKNDTVITFKQLVITAAIHSSSDATMVPPLNNDWLKPGGITVM